MVWYFGLEKIKILYQGKKKVKGYNIFHELFVIIFSFVYVTGDNFKGCEQFYRKTFPGVVAKITL